MYVSALVLSLVALSQANPLTRSTGTCANPPSVSGYVSLGCYTDGTQQRGLIGPKYIGPIVDLQSCATYCTGYSYFSVENSKECYCGNTLLSTSVPSWGCNYACIANATETCGGFDNMNVYYNPQPAPVPTVNGFTYQGCYSDGSSNRALTSKSTRASTISVETCATFCTGFHYFGVENGDECYCGNTISQPSLWASLSCSTACAGNWDETCGGFGAINIYVA